MSSFSNYLSSALPRKDIKAATSIAPRPSWFTLKSTSLTEVDADLAVNKSVLYDAASTKAVDSELVVETLLKCERLVKDRNKMGKGQGQDQKEGGRMAMELMRNIVGSWRLIFTTGTIKQQKKTGVKVNYFPLKAVQSFTDAGGITNAIYIGDYPALKFEGCYDLVEVGDSMVRVEVRLSEERRLQRSDSKSMIPLSYITNRFPLVASLMPFHLSLRSSPR